MKPTFLDFKFCNDSGQTAVQEFFFKKRRKKQAYMYITVLTDMPTSYC